MSVIVYSLLVLNDADDLIKLQNEIEIEDNGEKIKQYLYDTVCDDV